MITDEQDSSKEKMDRFKESNLIFQFLNPELDGTERRESKEYKAATIDYRRMNARLRMERISAGFESLDELLLVMEAVTGYCPSRNTAYSYEGGKSKNGCKVGKQVPLDYLVALCLTVCAVKHGKTYWLDMLGKIISDSLPIGFEKAFRQNLFEYMARAEAIPADSGGCSMDREEKGEETE